MLNKQLEVREDFIPVIAYLLKRSRLIQPVSEWEVPGLDLTVIPSKCNTHSEGIVGPIEYLKAGRLCVDSQRLAPGFPK